MKSKITQKLSTELRNTAHRRMSSLSFLHSSALLKNQANMLANSAVEIQILEITSYSETTFMPIITLRVEKLNQNWEQREFIGDFKIFFLHCSCKSNSHLYYMYPKLTCILQREIYILHQLHRSRIYLVILFNAITVF